MAEAASTPPARRLWQVGALCRAIADALDVRFNPVTVRGEISGFSRAASGHCYFTLKDAGGQVRCAMFRRAASLVDFSPRDGDSVEVRGRLDVYDARGDLQLVVESLVRDGQGTLFEQFLRLKAKLEAEGLFDPARKRSLPAMPRAIGLVTSRGAAALHDVATALRRRAPQVPVLLAPAAVQGAQAPAELVQALEALYRQSESAGLDVILLVRGGGSLEDLWAFNDEQVARAIVRSPVPLVCGVGHETDFSIADFCADLRAPTPTAAAELVIQPREAWVGDLQSLQGRLHDAALRRIDRAGQRLDAAASRLGRPSGRIGLQHQQLERLAQRLRHALSARLVREANAAAGVQGALGRSVVSLLAQHDQRLQRAQVRLASADPREVLRRGYALLTDRDGQVVSRVAQVRSAQTVQALLADGRVDLRVAAQPPD